MEAKNQILHFFKVLANLQEHYEFHKAILYDIRHFQSSKLTKKVDKVRSKPVIRVAFIVYDIAKWKSEALYISMLKHPRFEPVVVPVMCFHGDYLESMRQFERCIKFLDEKGYSYVVGDSRIDIDDLAAPDIIFYGELYDHLFHDNYCFKYNTKRKSLACYIPYCFHNTNIGATINQISNNLVWMSFVENEATLNDFRKIMTNRAVNHFATGLPIQDSFIAATKHFNDVWKPQRSRKKRIIWAPSHTIKGENIENAYEQSTFLDVADDMLRLAEKYKDSIQWAFKPHPVLKRKLVQTWGQERTDSYYSKWEGLGYAQLEEGQYIDLFMSSDAMIHDCMSFMVEYMYTDNPIMFLSNGHNNMDICNTQTRDAYALHYKGDSISDIEKFIDCQLLNSNDTLKARRIEYRKQYLIPHGANTACQNIINQILGI